MKLIGNILKTPVKSKKKGVSSFPAVTHIEENSSIGGRCINL